MVAVGIARATAYAHTCLGCGGHMRTWINRPVLSDNADATRALHIGRAYGFYSLDLSLTGDLLFFAGTPEGNKDGNDKK
jgi:hypothetical protein